LAISHRAYIIENGMVALQGAASDLALDPELKRRYLGL
jgi:branched-chain amino acid transport system ATP-binding protein